MPCRTLLCSPLFHERTDFSRLHLRQFLGLLATLNSSGKAIDSHATTALEVAAARDPGPGKKTPMVKRKPSKKKKKKKKGEETRKRDARVEKFIKATRFVRGYGAASIHPSAKIELHGLRMQALQGNCSTEGGAEQGGKSSASALQDIKQEAWRAAKGKTQEEAMEEYLSRLTSLAPNWKIAHLAFGREGDDGRQKPRHMVWVLKLAWKVRATEERIASAINRRQKETEQSSFKKRAITRIRGLQVTSIEILQSSNEVNARLWCEEKAPTIASKGTESEDHELSDFEQFVATVPENFTIEDCIIDKDKHATMEEQRKHYSKLMRSMARSGDDEDDGWAEYGKTIQDGVPSEKQLDIYAKDVEWSHAPQLRTVVDTDLTVEEVWIGAAEYRRGSFKDFRIREDVNKSSGGQRRDTYQIVSSGDNSVYLFSQIAEDTSSISALYYRILHFPW